MRNQIFITLLGIFLLFSNPAACEEIAWGKPVMGIRVGIACSIPDISATERPEFTVYIQNVTNRSIVIPDPDSFMPKTHTRVTGYFECPLYPIVESIEDQQNYIWGGHYTGGQELKSVAHETRSLSSEETLTIHHVFLEKHSYTEGHYDYGDRTTVEKWSLSDGTYLISFGFENESAKFKGKKVWTGNVTSAELKIHVTKPSIAGYNINGKFSLPKKNYFIGEPIYVTFEVTNNGKEGINFNNGGDYTTIGSHLGRHLRFSFRAVSADRKEAEDPRSVPGDSGLGLSGLAMVGPDKTYTETILLNSYRAFRVPGDYTVTCYRNFLFTPAGTSPEIDIPGIESNMPAVEIKSQVSLTLREDPAVMREYLKNLENRSTNRLDYQRVHDELGTLALYKNKLALGTLKKLALESNPYQKDVIEWLGYYTKEETEEVLTKIAEDKDPVLRQRALRMIAGWGDSKHDKLILEALRSKDARERESAVMLCSGTAPKEAFEILLKMDGDEDPIVRRYLSAALAKYRNEKAVPVLLKLLHDPDPDHFIMIWAANSLGELGHKEGIPVMIDLLKLEETRRYRGNIVDVLEKLSGKQYREDWSEWYKWWETEGNAKYKAVE